MQNNDNLIRLLEQAASKIMSLNTDDLSEINHLQSIFEQIRQDVDQLQQVPGQLLAQAKQATTTTAGYFQQLLQQQVQDSDKAVEAISGSICLLQNLIEQMSNDINCEKSDCNIKEENEIQGKVIPQDDVPLILDFLTESAEHIESGEAALLELESKPGDKETLNLIFRGFHTIKGMAGFLNLTEIGSLAHTAENLLDMARKDQILLTGQNSDLIFESIDMLKKMSAKLKDAVEQNKPIQQQEKLDKLLRRLKAVVDGQSLSQSLNTVQAQEIDKKLDQILEGTNSQTDEVEDHRQDAGDRRKVNTILPPEQERRNSSDRRAANTVDDKIKVSTARLDNLINMAGELVIAHLMVEEEVKTKFSSEHELLRKVNQQSKIVRELQSLSMLMRLVPINAVFQKMARLVRDLSQKADKQIKFEVEGEETELDRTVVDKIADPLVHMIRNSVDHGIETSADRQKAGKNPMGRIKLRAFHQAGNIVIQIEDDGKGLNKQRILEKAIKNGLVDAGQELSDDEIYKLIFHAGLSTAEVITSVSGRGVGMDVVKKNIEALRGRIDIASTQGQGTVFTITLPLTLAIIDGQIAQIGDERFIVPINTIIRSLKADQSHISSVQGKGKLFMERGQLLPFVELGKLFGINSDSTESIVIIVEAENRKCCLQVDKLLGQQQVVIKNLGDGIGKVAGISGGAIMGDGKISLILDIPGIIDLAQR